MEDSKAKSTQTKRVKLDPNIFDAVALTDEVKLEIATGIVESHLATSAVDKQHLLSQLLDQKGLFEYIASVLSTDAYDHLLESILATFPTVPEEFERSFAYTMLKRLSNYFGTLSSSPSMGDRGRAVELAPQALQALAVLCATLEAAEVEPEKGKIKGKARRTSQSATKKMKRATQASIDKTIFTKIQVSVPNSKEDAEDLVHKVLGDQRDSLTFYLEGLRKPEFSAAIKGLYIPEVLASPAAISDGLSSQITEPSFQVSEATVAMKDALSLETAEGFGDWRVFLPQRAHKDLRVYCKKNPRLYDITLKKLRELSHGLFSPDNQKRLAGSDNGIPIYEAKMTGDTRLVYRIDCLQEIESEVESQVLRVYGIYTHAQIHGDRFWDAVSRTVSGAGSEYRNKCTPSRRRGGSAVAPMSWPPIKGVVENERVDLPDLTIKDKQELQALLVSEKFAAFTQDLLFTIVHDEDVAPLFHMSHQEQAIVLHPGSCFVLGRSGTGKTTTMMIKMVGIERMWRSRQHAQAMSRPRQIFVTQSAKLAIKVQEYYEKMVAFFEARGIVPDSSGEASPLRAKNRPSGLYDYDEEDEYREDFPKKFSELNDEHFPLFVTYHRLCRLLEEDLAANDKDIRRRMGAASENDEEDQSISNDYMLQKRKSFVSYSTFLDEYWKHFPEHLTKKLDPSSIFAEFMGVIRGSEQALQTKKGYLDRATYLSMSHRITALNGFKELLYDLFELYMKQKTQRSEYDAADRTQAILRRLRKDGVQGTKVDFVYVDEVQDNLLIDTEILRSICRRPEGMFWAGDTAQTISAGSSFRFGELKAFMFHLEKEENTHNPGYFHLNHNFRSHSGIVQAAQTVINAITKFSPYMIDVLDEEEGLIEGPKPLFIGGTGELDMPHFDQFMINVNGTAIEFGHQQCILVRNDAAREQLRKEFGGVGVILTLYESKGLEFEDVLLYNFFADSTVGASQWRVLLNCLSDHGQNCPTYDELKHHGVCFELKCLYVAVTRARSNLWIVDYSEKGESMRFLWSCKEQVDTWVHGTAVPRLVQSSSQEQWASTAEDLFHKKNYKEAMLAFGRAGEDFSKHYAIAEAFHLRDVARKRAANNRTKQSDSAPAFGEAARAFHRIAEKSDMGDKKVYFRTAADCYVGAKDSFNAAQCYELAERYTDAAKHHRLAGSFDDAVRVVKTFDTVEPSVAQNIIDVSALFYLKGDEFAKAIELLGSTEEALDYADTYGLDNAKAHLLEQCGRHAEAAVLHLDNNNLTEAVRLCLRVPEDRYCSERVSCRLMDEFWDIAGLADFDRAQPRFRLVASLASHFRQASISVEQRRRLAIIPVVSSGDKQRLMHLGVQLLEHDLDAAFFCLDHAFSEPLHIETASTAEVERQLSYFLAYAKVLYRLTFSSNTADIDVLQKLLAIRPTNNLSYQVRRDSLLYQTSPTLQALAKRQATAAPVTVQRRDLGRFLMSTLKERLLHRVKGAMKACEVSKAFSTCLQYALEGHCNLEKNCSRMHLASYDRQAYQRRISLHAMAICVYQALNGVEVWSRRQEQQRNWLIRLKDALYPPATKLGAFHNVKDVTIPLEAMQTISAWIEDSLFASKTNPPHFLNDFFRFCFLSKFIGGSYIPDYVYRAPCVYKAEDDWLMRGKERVNIVQDALRFLTNSPPVPLSSALLMVKHIIEEELPIEVGLLCDLLDMLCGTLVIARRLKYGANLHTVTFPRSWFLRLRYVLDGSCPLDIQLGWQYVKFIELLLKQLYKRAGHLRLNSSTQAAGGGHHPLILRSIYLARICHNLCYLGYNLRDESLRLKIVQALTSVQQLDDRRMFPQLYHKFVTAPNWSELSRVLRENTLGGTADPLVELFYEKAASSTAPTRTVTRIVYRKLSDILGLLDNYLPSNPVVSSAPNSPTLPAQTPDATPQNIAPEDIGEQEEDCADVFGDHSAAIEFTEQHEAVSITFTDVQADRAVSHTEEEMGKISRAVDIYIKARNASATRRKHVRKEAVLFAREFKAYLTETDSKARSFRTKTALWAFPHLALSFKGILQSLRGKKVSVKKQLANLKTDHLQLDDLMSETTKFNTLIKAADRLLKAIEPRAEIHQLTDKYLEALSKLASDAEAFMSLSTLPQDVVEEWAGTMRVGVDGIRVQKGPLVKAKRPELVIDDELDLDVYA